MPKDERSELVAGIIDRTVKRCQELHDYAGRPAWEQVLSEEIAAALTPSEQGSVVRLREALEDFLPRNVCLTNKNVPDDWIVPLECTMGELRRLRDALSIGGFDGN